MENKILQKLHDDMQTLLRKRRAPDPGMLWGIEEIMEHTGKSRATVSKIINGDSFMKKVPRAKHVEKRWQGSDVVGVFK